MATLQCCHVTMKLSRQCETDHVTCDICETLWNDPILCSKYWGMDLTMQP